MPMPRPVAVIIILACALLGASHIAAGQAKYGVTVRAVDAAALANVRTYTWTVGRPAFNKDIDALIIAAVDRELTARGLTKLATGQGDVAVTYGSLSRTDVDLKNTPKNATPADIPVGTLIVNLTGAGSKKQVFSVRLDKPFDWAPSTYEATVNAAVAAMFEKYPAPSKR